MGAKLYAPAFQNCVMENLCDAISTDEKCISANLMDHVYLKAGQGSPLRMLFVDALAVRLNHYDESMDGWKRLEKGLDFAEDLHHATRRYWEHPDQNPRYEKADDGGDRKVYMIADTS